MKQLAPLCLLLSVVLLLSCQDDRLPTTPNPSLDGTAAAARGGGPPVGQTDPADAEGEIQQLLTALFPPGEQGEAKSLFATIKASTARGDQAAAEAGVRELVSVGLQAFAEGSLRDPGGPAPPTTLEALEELVDLLFAFVGRTAPAFDLAAVQQLQGETDFAVQIVGPEGGTVVTNTEFAGVDVPDEAIGSDDGTDEEVLVTILRLDPDDQPGGRCLPTGLPQLQGCYEFERSPDGDFADFVTVGVCIDQTSDPEWQEYLLHKFDPDHPGDGVVALDEAPAGFLDCQGFAPLAAAEIGLFGTFASAGLDALQRFGDRWLVSPLRAANAGAGGLTLSFSDVGWAQAAELTVVSGDGQVGTAGQTLANPLVLSVTGTHHDVGGIVDGALVTFEVTGDATLGAPVALPDVAAVNLATGPDAASDGAGQVSVPVTLGASATGTVTVEATVAGADASPLSYTIQVGTPGQITGSVLDHTGAGIPGAQVLLPALNQGTLTNPAGDYGFLTVPLGPQLVTLPPGPATSAFAFPTRTDTASLSQANPTDVVDFAAVGVFDQEQTQIGTGNPLAIGGASEQQVAQTVTAGVTGSLVEIRMPVACSGQVSVIAEIRQLDVNALPDTTVAPLATTTVPGSQLTSQQTFSRFTFAPASQPFFQSGDVFAVVLRASVNSTQASCSMLKGPGDVYADGDGAFLALPNPGWTFFGDDADLPFRTVVFPQAPPVP